MFMFPSLDAEGPISQRLRVAGAVGNNSQGRFVCDMCARARGVREKRRRTHRNVLFVVSAIAHYLVYLTLLIG